jgi:hypothetical protein
MAELRHITLQPDTNIRIDGKKLGHLQVILYILANDQRFNRDATGIRAKKRLRKLFDGKKAGDVVTTDEPDWRLLHEAFEHPTNGYFMKLSMPGTSEAFDVDGEVFLPYIDAMSDEATKKDPLPKEAKAREKAKQKLREKSAAPNPESNGAARPSKRASAETA